MALLQSLILVLSAFALVFGAPTASNNRIEKSSDAPLAADALQPQRQPVSFFSAKPVMKDNFADPALFTESNNSFWAFATDNVARTTERVMVHSGFNVQVANSSDFESWNYLHSDALPFAGKWAANPPHVWAPDVVKLDNGKYILYYAAAPAEDPTTHCIGAASSDSVQGPYKPQDTPFYCSNEEGGAIDPAGFRDPDGGKRYVIFKIDGNQNQPGGKCGNLNLNPRATPIRMQEVSEDNGVTPIGNMVQVLDRDDSDGPLIEAPSMVAAKHDGAANGYIYILFYSSHCFLTPNYNVRYAVSTNGIFNGAKPIQRSIAKGDYKKNPKPLISTNSSSLVGPGGLSIAQGDARHIVFHAAQQADKPGSRQMHTGMVHIEEDIVTL